ncbi:hypothetical protein sos41_10240 [Alphaproteobacteria bacterium SO-S41]|nr:hypothetical protein sos41_10240 [Alphaproteobacteria bacterium SO-S41]
MITVSAFRWVPPFAQGLVRDLRVRWALEEAGLPYEARIIGFEDQATPGYRALQPFGQVPAYEENGLTLFESGAIVLHIAARSENLMPADAASRARAMTWVISALNTVEPPIANLAEIDLFPGDAAVKAARRPEVEQRVRLRLGEVAEVLGTRDYLEDRFTAGDLMMTTVLRNLRQTDIVASFPTLAAYQARCEARPAFTKALDAQMAVFAAA